METSFIHSSICRLDLTTLCLKWDILMVFNFDLMYEHPACVSGRTFLQQKRMLWLHHISCWRHMRSWRTLTFVWHQRSVSSWSTGLEYWTWGNIEIWLCAFQIFSLLLHILLWGGSLNLLLRYLFTYFYSVNPPFLVWSMNIMIWHSYIQGVLVLDICLSQS